MGTIFQARPEGVPPDRLKLEPRLGRGLPKQLLASAFGLWTRGREWLGLGYSVGRNLGPGLGMITKRLHELDLSGALPGGPPQRDLIDNRAFAFAYDSTPTPQLRNANVW